jgi:O-antigen/teichoic acid export membrane protein
MTSSSNTDTVTNSPKSQATQPAPQSRTWRNVLSNWGGYAFSILIGFFVSPFVVHHLGNSLYGVWVLIMSLTGYLGLLDAGVRGAVTRYVAKFHAEANHEDASRTASAALAIFATAGLLAILISFGLAFVAIDHFKIPQEYHAAARVVLCLAGFTMAASFLGGVFGGILVALQRFDINNLIQVAGSGLRSLAIIIALLAGKGIVSLAFIQFVFACTIGLSSAWACFRLYPELRIRLSKADSDHFRLILTFSIYSFMLHIFAYLILYTDSVVIAAFLPVSLVTFFSIAVNLITYSKGLISGITSTMTPLASRLEARKDFSELRRVTLQNSRFASALILPICLTFILRGKTFIGLWMGQEYAALSWHVLWVLTLSVLFSTGPSVPWAVSFGMSKHKPLVPIYLCESFINLGLSIYLVRKIGIVGVAWGTTLPDLVVCLFFWPWYVRRILQIPIWSFVANAWVRPGLAMLPFAACSYAVDHFWRASNLSVFFSQVALILPVAFIGFWFLCLSPEDRETYSNSFVQLLHRFKR